MSLPVEFRVEELLIQALGIPPGSPPNITNVVVSFGVERPPRVRVSRVLLGVDDKGRTALRHITSRYQLIPRREGEAAAPQEQGGQAAEERV